MFNLELVHVDGKGKGKGKDKVWYGKEPVKIEYLTKGGVGSVYVATAARAGVKFIVKQGSGLRDEYEVVRQLKKMRVDCSNLIDVKALTPTMVAMPLYNGGDVFGLLESDFFVGKSDGCKMQVLKHLFNTVRSALRCLLKKNFYYMDCLLYTSPSPRDRTRSRMPSSA